MLIGCKICGKLFEKKTSGQFCAACKDFISNKQGNKRQRQAPEEKKRVSLLDRYMQSRRDGTDGGLSYGYWVAREQARRGSLGAEDEEGLLGL